MRFLPREGASPAPLPTLQSSSAEGSSGVEGTLEQEPVLARGRQEQPGLSVEELGGAAHPKWFKILS